MQMNFLALRAVPLMPAFLALALLGIAILLPSRETNAQQNVSIAISVKDHRFQPARISGPANRALSIRVKNLDATAMEFESVSLRVEKIIAAGSEGVVNVRPLAPGSYEFFDDFHQETRGVLAVQ